MPIIQRGQTRATNLDLRNISSSLAIQAASSGALIGDEIRNQARTTTNVANQLQRESSVVNSFGKRMVQQGSNYMKAALASIEDAQYNDAMTNATKEFNTAADERQQQTTDEEGKPTYGTLQNDVDTLGKQTTAKYAQTLSPNAQKRFVRSFTRHTGNKTISAGRTARKQHLDHSRSTLYNALDTMTSEALQDTPENMNNYSTNIKEMITDAKKNGIIDKDEAVSLTENSRKNIRLTMYSKMIKSNPAMAVETLSHEDAAQLGLRETERNTLLNRAQTATVELANEQEAQVRELQVANEERQSTNFTNLDFGIMEGTVVKADIMEQSDLGEITEKQADTLIKRKDLQNVKRQADLTKNDKIRIMKESGSPDFSVSSSSLNKYYHNISASLSNPETGEPATLTQKTSVAAQIPMKIPAYTKELSFHATHGEMDTAAEALRNFQMIKVKNPVAIESLDNNGKNVLSLADYYVTHTGISDAEAITRARTSILDSNTESKALRSREFTTFKEFDVARGGKQVDRLDDTMRDAFDVDGFFGIGAADIDPDARGAFARLAKDAYIQNNDGNLDAAIASAVDSMRGAYGVSEVNGRSTLMFMPPEQTFGVSTKDLRSDLNRTAVEDLPEGAVDRPDSVKIQADYLTRIDPTRSGYLLTHAKEVDGELIEVPVVDPVTQEPQRYLPNASSINLRSGMDKVEKAKQERASREAARAAGQTVDEEGLLITPGEPEESLLNKLLTGDVFSSTRGNR